MKARYSACLLILVTIAVEFSRGRSNPTSPVHMVPVPRARLCITEGALEELEQSHLAVAVPKMRAFVAAATPQTVEARLTYQGPTSGEARLGSGQMRRQFGLKLRAQDGCNLVYAMWRIEPESRLVVSVKRNAGMNSSSECGNRGYRNIKPRRSSPVPRLLPGDSHTLLADMKGSVLSVSVDGRPVWEGDTGPEALSFDGPVGVRTDNGRFEFGIWVKELGVPIACHGADKGED